MQKLLTFLESPKALFLIIFINFLLHLPFFNMPPRGTHVWRQCNTMAVARNMYEESMNIFKPRVDRRGDSAGVTGMQFPSYEFLAASAYKLFGNYEFISRILSFLIFSLGIIGFYYLVLLLFNSNLLAFIGTWAMSWSPDLFYHSINALPDILALSSSILGLVFFLKWNKAKKNSLLVYATFFITLGGLTKLQYLNVGFPIAVIVLRDVFNKRYSQADFIKLFTFAVISVGTTLLWYKYSINLIERSGLKDFGLELKPAESLAEGIKIIKTNLLSDIPELLLNYSGTILFAIGVYAFFRSGKTNHSFFIPFMAWVLSLAAYHIIELKQMADHQYYMMPYIPVFFIVVVAGADFLRKRSGALLIILLLAQPVLACSRIIPARWTAGKEGIPTELYNKNSREALEKSTPNNELSIVGPDNSGCIYFYFLHKKGFGFLNKEELLIENGGKPSIESYIEKGAKNLYTNDTSIINDERFIKYIDTLIRQEGSFYVFKLKEL